MCWCWSDLPQHRPNFTQILKILRNKSFTNLLATAEVQEPASTSRPITAACVTTVIAPKVKSITSREVYPSMSRLMSLVQFKASDRGEPALQVFYGTENGHCEMMQFQSTGTLRKVHVCVCVLY